MNFRPCSSCDLMRGRGTSRSAKALFLLLPQAQPSMEEERRSHSSHINSQGDGALAAAGSSTHANQPTPHFTFTESHSHQVRQRQCHTHYAPIILKRWPLPLVNIIRAVPKTTQAAAHTDIACAPCEVCSHHVSRTRITGSTPSFQRHVHVRRL
jgi:hypothetical protein